MPSRCRSTPRSRRARAGLATESGRRRAALETADRRVRGPGLAGDLIPESPHALRAGAGRDARAVSVDVDAGRRVTGRLARAEGLAERRARRRHGASGVFGFATGTLTRCCRRPVVASKNTHAAGPSGAPGRAAVFDRVAARLARRAAGPSPSRGRRRAKSCARARRGARRRDCGDVPAARRCSMRIPSRRRSPHEIALLAAGAAVQAAEHALDTRRAGRSRWSVRRDITRSAIARWASACTTTSRSRPRTRCARGLRASRSSTSTSITATARNGCSTTIRACSTSRHISFPFYPGTGAADEIGAGAGAGFTLNVPLEAGATDADYDARLRTRSSCRSSRSSRRSC